MKRSLVVLSLVAPLSLLAACSQPEVVAEAALEQEGEVVALSELPVRLLPYDRDAIFDSLAAEYGEPEPQIPPEVLAQQERVAEAQEDWRIAETRWNEVRDSLRNISETLNALPRTSPRYNALFRQFGRLESEEQQVKQRMDQAFAQFDQMQRQFLTQADSIRIVREEWAERAFEGYDQAVAARLEAMGREELADTTNAAGVARFNAPEGRWWVYTRYTLPYEELYWNVPIEVTGDSTYIRINRENAEVRPVL